MGRQPRFGHTRHGQAVHGRTIDHHPEDTAYQRFNKRLAIKITGGVGSMSCAYLFACIALISLPAALASGSVIVIVSWVAQTFLQLVLLSVIIVGQNVQSEASDARAAKTFEDVEAVKQATVIALDRLDTTTTGGLAEVLAAQSAARTQINALSDLVRANSTPQAGSG